MPVTVRFISFLLLLGWRKVASLALIARAWPAESFPNYDNGPVERNCDQCQNNGLSVWGSPHKQARKCSEEDQTPDQNAPKRSDLLGHFL